DRQRRRDLDGTQHRTGIQHDVLRHIEGLEAAVLGVPGERGYLVGVNTVITRVVANSELHGILSPAMFHKVAAVPRYGVNGPSRAMRGKPPASPRRRPRVPGHSACGKWILITGFGQYGGEHRRSC